MTKPDINTETYIVINPDYTTTSMALDRRNILPVHQLHKKA